MDPNSLREGFQTIFLKAYNAATPVWPKIATKTTSTGASEEYGWLGNVPGIREMNGERMPKGLSTYDYVIKNKEFEGTVEVRQTDIDDNKIANKDALVTALGNRAALFPDQLVFDLLKANGLAYDGQNFFDTDHSEGLSGTQSNDLSGSDIGSATTLTEAVYEAAKIALGGFKDDQGEIMYPDMGKPVVLVPLALEGPAKKLFRSNVGGGDTNIYADDAEVIASARLTNAKQFYLLNVSQGLLPLIYQERQFIPMEYDGGDATQEGSHERFMRRRLLFGPYIRANAGYGDWRTAVRVTLS